MNSAYREALRRGELAGLAYRLAVPREPLAGHDGFRLGRQTGASLDFKDYRDYQPGDDLRHIDWRAYARTDRLIVKLFRQEVCPHADLILDGSASMALDGGAKAATALGLLAALAAAAENARCTRRIWVAGDALRALPQSADPPEHWQGLHFNFAGNPANALIAGAAWRGGGVRVLVSDLLWPADPLAVLRRLADGAAATAVVQVLGATDADPPEPGNLRLADVETGEELDLYLDAAGRARYAAALVAHRTAWETACRQAQAGFAVVVAADAADAAPPLRALEEARLVEAA